MGNTGNIVKVAVARGASVSCGMRRTPLVRPAVALLVLASAGMAAAQQSPRPQAPPAPAPTGVIAGLVTAAETGSPLRNAQVTLTSGTPQRRRLGATDDTGRFQFTNLPAGAYTLVASKAGYLDMVYGARRPGSQSAGVPLDLAAAQKLDRADLKLPRGSVITGTILDQFGDPVFGCAVRVMRLVYGYGEKYATATNSSDTTDDRGHYRIAGLMPGDYVVSAVPKDTVSQTMELNQVMRDRLGGAIAAARATGNEGTLNYRPDAMELLSQPIDPRGYVPVHYPGSVLASGAMPVRLGLNDEAPGIDIRLQTVHTANVTGSVTWAGGEVPAGLRIQLMDPAMPMPTLGSWWTSIRPGNTFVFYGVSPGAYTVRVHTTSGGTDLYGVAGVDVDPSRSNAVELQLQRGMSVSGSVSLEGAPVPLTRLRVMADPVPKIADPELGREFAVVDANGRFTIRGLAPVLYRFSIDGLPPGWRLGSAIFNERDAVDHLLPIQAGANATGGVLKLAPVSTTAEVSGVLTDVTGKPVVNAVVLLFPEDRQLWLPYSPRIQRVSPTADGRFAIRGLRPGDYRIAGSDPGPNQWWFVDYLNDLLPMATAISLAPGERKQHDVRVR